ncbi:MAG: glycine cleavage system protein GcvH [Candidatus Dadabacteria bacterium]|nr:MAG: glycine cleavage system protein GcvH [Candidatus Dadabacteria bacterium]
MTYPAECKYTKEHEWAREENGVLTCGITSFAQDELGEIVFVELPEIGKELKQGDSACVVESTKAASDVYAPVSGTVKEVNSALEETPTLINSDSFGDGWIFKLENYSSDELSSLMSAEEYSKYIEEKS